MRTSYRFTPLAIILVLTALLAASPGAAGAAGKRKEASFDFAKTGTYLKEIEARPDFPVSAVLANDYVSSYRALKGGIDGGKRSAIVSYFRKTQQSNGGFAADRVNRVPSLLFTGIALETLQDLQATGSVDLAAVKSFVTSLGNRDGGFGFSPQSRGSSLASTCLAVEILGRTGGMALLDAAKTAAYIRGFERKGGGFGYVKGSALADARNTYLAVNALQALGMLQEPTRRGALHFLGTTVYLNKSSRQQPELDEQLYTIKALKVLGASGSIDRKRALTFMHRLYIPVNGGFGPQQGYGSAPDSTATALKILSEIGAIKRPAPQLARR